MASSARCPITTCAETRGEGWQDSPRPPPWAAQGCPVQVVIAWLPGAGQQADLAGSGSFPVVARPAVPPFREGWESPSQRSPIFFLHTTPPRGVGIVSHWPYPPQGVAVGHFARKRCSPPGGKHFFCATAPPPGG